MKTLVILAALLGQTDTECKELFGGNGDPDPAYASETCQNPFCPSLWFEKPTGETTHVYNFNLFNLGIYTMAISKIHELSLGQFVHVKNADGSCFYNPGRKTNWGDPRQELVPEMMDGYEVSKGLMQGLSVKAFEACFSDLLDFGGDVQKWLREERKRQNAVLASSETTRTYKFSKRNGESDEWNSGEADDSLDVTDAAVAEHNAGVENIKIVAIPFSGQRRADASGHVSYTHKRQNPEGGKYVWAFKILEVSDFYEGDPSEATPEMLREALFDTILRENQENAKLGYDSIGTAILACSIMRKTPWIGETELGQRLSLADRGGKSNRGHRQRLWRTAKVDFNRPELKLSDRFAMSPRYVKEGDKVTSKVKYVAGEYVNPLTLHKEDLQSLLGKRKADTKARPNVTRAYNVAAGKGDKATEEKGVNYGGAGQTASVEVLEAYIAIVMGGRRTQEKITPSVLLEMAGASQFEKAILVCPSAIFRCIASGDRAALYELGVKEDNDDYTAFYTSQATDE